MEALSSSEMSILTRAIWRNSPEDAILHVSISSTEIPITFYLSICSYITENKLSSEAPLRYSQVSTKLSPSFPFIYIYIYMLHVHIIDICPFECMYENQMLKLDLCVPGNSFPNSLSCCFLGEHGRKKSEQRQAGEV
jgi:hypothetical protein